MLLFMRWVKLRQGSTTAAFPFKEAAVYKYVDHLRTSGAKATKARSFVEAVGFTSGLLEIAGIKDVTASRRIRGAVHASYKTKRLTLKSSASCSTVPEGPGSRRRS